MAPQLRNREKSKKTLEKATNIPSNTGKRIRSEKNGTNSTNGSNTNASVGINRKQVKITTYDTERLV